MTILIRAAGLGAALALASAAAAQSGPTLPTMPPPPSFSDPLPRDEAAPRRAPRNARQGSGQATSTTGGPRPRRYVPEEFDRGAPGEPDGTRPIVTEGGRPGMGMRF